MQWKSNRERAVCQSISIKLFLLCSVWPWLISLLNSFQPHEEDLSCPNGKNTPLWLSLRKRRAEWNQEQCNRKNNNELVYKFKLNQNYFSSCWLHWFWEVPSKYSLNYVDSILCPQLATVYLSKLLFSVIDGTVLYLYITTCKKSYWLHQSIKLLVVQRNKTTRKGASKTTRKKVKISGWK